MRWICPHNSRQTRSKDTVEAENVRPRGVWTQIFPSSATKMSICSKELLALYMAFLEPSHIYWETKTKKPTIVLTHYKNVTRFFQTKAIPPTLWNAFAKMLQFQLKKTHITGSINTAAGFLSGLQLKVTEKIRRKNRKDIRRSSNTHGGDNIFFERRRRRTTFLCTSGQ